MLPTASVFDEFSVYWSEISDADNTQKQVAFVKSKVAPVGLTLDLACGNGRHIVALNKAGYGMVGVDISLRLLKIAKERLVQSRSSAELVKADIRFLPFRPRTFSAVISLDTSFGYFPTEEEDLLSLREAGSVVAEDGKIVLDVFNRPQMVQRYGESGISGEDAFGSENRNTLSETCPPKWREYPDFFLLQKRSVQPGTRLLVDFWVFRDKKTDKLTTAEHVVRLYGLEDVEKLAQKAGLHVSNAFGDYNAKTYDENSTRLIVLTGK